MPGEKKDDPERTLFFHWTRHSPELYTNIALLKDLYKIVGNTNYNSGREDFELYDLKNDPYEQNNIIGIYQQVELELRDELDKVFSDLTASPYLSAD